MDNENENFDKENELENLLNSIKDDLTEAPVDLNKVMNNNQEFSKKLNSIKQPKPTIPETMAVETVPVKRKNLKYKRYIGARIPLCILTGGMSEIAFYLGGKSTEDGIRVYSESADE